MNKEITRSKEKNMRGLIKYFVSYEDDEMMTMMMTMLMLRLLLLYLKSLHILIYKYENYNKEYCWYAHIMIII